MGKGEEEEKRYNGMILITLNMRSMLMCVCFCVCVCVYICMHLVDFSLLGDIVVVGSRAQQALTKDTRELLYMY